MNKVCIIVSKFDGVDDMVKQLSADGDLAIDVWNYQDIAMEISGPDSYVYNISSGKELKKYDKILVLTTPEHDKNHIFSALGCFARKNDLKMFDDEFSNNSGKLYEMFLFHEYDLPVPDTAFGPVTFLQKKLQDFGGQAVLKATHNSRGKDNFLVRSDKEIAKVIEENPDKDFILQRFIPNVGDYRIIVLDYIPRMALYRHRAEGTKEHRNNTSVGGAAEVIDLDEVNEEVSKLAVEASKAFKVKVSGADIVQDSETGRHYVLEVNRTPQLATGGFYDEKFAALKDLLEA